MLAYLRRNPLGNTAVIAVLVCVLITYLLIFLLGYVYGMDAILSLPILFFIIDLPLSVIAAFNVYRYLSKDLQKSEIVKHDNHLLEIILLGLVGLGIVLIRRFAFTETISHSYTILSGWGMLIWLLIVVTRDWNLIKKIIWVIVATSLFVYVAF